MYKLKKGYQSIMSRKYVFKTSYAPILDFVLVDLFEFFRIRVKLHQAIF